MDPIAERVARNDAAFRDADERIAPAACVADVSPAPFICEYADRSCTEIVRVTLDEYERIRENSRWFLNANGHEAAALGHVEVVERRPGYVVVEKVDEAGELAERLDGQRMRSGG
jgi:hypothetical protein